MVKDTFCIKIIAESEYHEGVLANGDSCLSLGFGDVYENIIIDETQSTYLYWEHADDTQPVYVTPQMEDIEDLTTVFVDIEVVHHANENYAKLVPDESSSAFTVSWEEANQYCQAYGYLGLATILSSELNAEAAALCASEGDTDQCWIGAYVLCAGTYGVCDADDADVVKCWKWKASMNSDFIHSNWYDTFNDDWIISIMIIVCLVIWTLHHPMSGVLRRIKRKGLRMASYVISH
eukprot:562180_1